MPWDFKYRVPLSSSGSVCVFFFDSQLRLRQRTEVVANKKPETSGIPSRDRASQESQSVETFRVKIQAFGS